LAQKLEREMRLDLSGDQKRRTGPLHLYGPKGLPTGAAKERPKITKKQGEEACVVEYKRILPGVLVSVTSRKKGVIKSPLTSPLKKKQLGKVFTWHNRLCFKDQKKLFCWKLERPILSLIRGIRKKIKNDFHFGEKKLRKSLPDLLKEKTGGDDIRHL